MRLNKLLLISLFLFFFSISPIFAFADNSSSDTVEITITHETTDVTGTRILELTGTNIHENGINPTVTLSGTALTVVSISGPGDKVTVELLNDQPEGTYNLLLTNNLGVSNFDVKIKDPEFVDGEDWELKDSPVDWGKRRFFGSVVYDNKMWVMGGHVFPSVKGKDVWSSTDGVTWVEETSAAAWPGRERVQAVAYDGKMWVMGGQATSGKKNDIWNSTDGINWTEVIPSNIWPARTSHQVVIFNNELWVIGGKGDSGDLNDAWHSADGITWTQATNSVPWGPKYEFQIIAYDNKLWMTGGANGDNDIWNSTDGANWTRVTQTAPFVKRHIHRMTVYKNRMWVLGGLGNSGIVNFDDVWSSTDGISWTQATGSAQWEARYGHEVLVFNDDMWVLGGFGANWLDNVWRSVDDVNNLTQQVAIENNTSINSSQDSSIETITTTNTTQQTSIDTNASTNTTQQTSIDTLQQQVAILQSGSGRDDADGVYMIFARDLIDNNQHLIDVNGVNLFEDENTTPFLFVGDNHDSLNLALTVIAQADISNTTLQQVVAELPASILNGTHRLSLSNSLGSSEFEVNIKSGIESNVLYQELHDGSQWESATNSAAWTARAHHTSIVYDNKMWVIGGCAPSNDCFSGGNLSGDAWYSSDGINWTQATASAPWTARYNHTSLVYDNKMWVIGGDDALGGVGNYKSDVWYSTDGTNWTQATANAAWSGRRGHTSIVYGNKMWVMGGRDNGSCSSSTGLCNDIWFSTDGTNWSQTTQHATWTGRRDAASIVYDNKMWIMGGGDNSGACTDGTDNICADVWSSTDGINWTEAVHTPGWVRRKGLTAVSYGGKMWIMGGDSKSAGGYKNDVWSSTDGVIWTQATSGAPWSQRQGHASLVYEGSIWTLGGNSIPNSGLKNDVWKTKD